MNFYFEIEKTTLMRTKDRFSKLSWSLIFILLLVHVVSLKADEWKVDGSLNQTLSYDDNVIMREDPEASLIYALTPVLNFSHRTEASEILANASYGIQRYLDISRLNRDNQRYGIDARYFTETLVWGLSTSYSLTPSRDVAQQESGDFDINSERKSFSISPSVSYKITEQDSLLFSGRYTDTSFSTGDFSDYEDKGLNLTWSRQWSERYTSALHLFYSNYKGAPSSRFPNHTTNDSFGLNVSSTYLLSDNWDLIGTVGGRVTETKISPSASGISETDTSAGFLLDSSANYTGENIRAKFNISKSLIPSSQGQLNDQFLIGFDMSYKLTERLSASLLANYQESDPVSGGNVSNKRTNYLFNPSLSWMLSPDWRVSTSYRYQNQKRTVNGSEQKADSNLFMLSLNYNWQGFSIAR